MHERNLSPQEMFEDLGRAWTPACRCTAQNPAEFQAWKAETLPRVLATLGEPPPAADPNPERVGRWTHEGVVKERWLIDVQEGLSAAFQVNFPPDLAEGERRAALLCCHGHGSHGKDAVMGNVARAKGKDEVAQANYDYGLRMAQAGFVTFAIDWMGFGERREGRKPNKTLMLPGSRDWCNLYYLHATLLGMTPLGINVAHGKAATDFACSLPGVDPERLGVLGLSLGGTMALWMGLADERFRAIEIACYSDLFAAFALRDLNCCGQQITPGLFRLVDLPDLQGLLAPRPLLVDIGVYDECFLFDNASVCYERVRAIYEAGGAAQALELELFPGGHRWGGDKAAEFFRTHLT